MLKLLFLLLLGYIIYLVIKAGMRKTVQSRSANAPQGEITHKDPVCGVYVTEEDAVVGRMEDKKVYFCSMECLEKYRKKLENKS